MLLKTARTPYICHGLLAGRHATSARRRVVGESSSVYSLPVHCTTTNQYYSSTVLGTSPKAPLTLPPVLLPSLQGATPPSRSLPLLGSSKQAVHIVSPIRNLSQTSPEMRHLQKFVMRTGFDARARCIKNVNAFETLIKGGRDWQQHVSNDNTSFAFRK